MSPVAHLQYGWWFAHWGEFGRRERAIIALAGAGPDLDGLSLIGGSDVYHRYHHILFHNAGSVLGAGLLAGVLLRRNPRAWLLTVFAFAMHIVEDYVTVAWNQYPWQPFSPAAVNLGDHFSPAVVQGLFQTSAMVFITAIMIWIYLRNGRTPLEIISPVLDRLLVGYAVLPWRHGCSKCSSRAHFQCANCGQHTCATHGIVERNLLIRCQSCAPVGG